MNSSQPLFSEYICRSSNVEVAVTTFCCNCSGAKLYNTPLKESHYWRGSCICQILNFFSCVNLPRCSSRFLYPSQVSFESFWVIPTVIQTCTFFRYDTIFQTVYWDWPVNSFLRSRNNVTSFSPGRRVLGWASPVNAEVLLQESENCNVLTQRLSSKR